VAFAVLNGKEGIYGRRGGVYYELEVGLDGGADLAEVLHRVVAPAFAAAAVAAVRRRRRGGGGGGRVERVHPCQRKSLCVCLPAADGLMDGFGSGNRVVSWVAMALGWENAAGAEAVYIRGVRWWGWGWPTGWVGFARKRKAGNGRALGWYFSRRNTPPTHSMHTGSAWRALDSSEASPGCFLSIALRTSSMMVAGVASESAAGAGELRTCLV
jgi:hypothetical protein